MQKILGFAWVGFIFEKGLETLNFVKKISISLLGFVPFGLFVFVLAPCGILTCI